MSWLEAALRGLRHLPDSRATRELAIDHLNLGYARACLGEFTEAITHAEEGRQIAEASEDPFALAVASNILGLILLHRGEAERAVLLAKSGLERSRTGDFGDKDTLYPLTWASSILGAAHVLAGHLTRGVPLLEEALEIAASRRPVQGQELWAVWLGEAYLSAGRIADARQMVTGALGQAVAQPERGNRAFALRALGKIAATGESLDVAEAEVRHREALELAEELEMRPLQAHCHLWLGKLYRRIGQDEQAQSELSTAIELYRSLGMTFWLPEAEAALAKAG